jgi:hypothetical protein
MIVKCGSDCNLPFIPVFIPARDLPLAFIKRAMKVVCNAASAISTDRLERFQNDGHREIYIQSQITADS